MEFSDELDNVYTYYGYDGLYDEVYYNDNIYSSKQWALMEAAGAVFLPAAGFREGVEVDYVNSEGVYWSSSSDVSGPIYFPYFCSSFLIPQFRDSRYYGQSVRLVR